MRFKPTRRERERFIGMIDVWRSASVAGVAAILIIIGAIPARAVEPLQFEPADFLILSADGSQQLGLCSFRMKKTRYGATIHGLSRYNSGESDDETVSLAIPRDGSVPRPVDFEHAFYDSNRRATLEVNANFITGRAHCADYRPESAYDETTTLSFPDDTWAGASVVIPIQRLLRSGATATGKLHFFTCTPGPKVYEVDIEPDSARSQWPYYRGDLVKVDVRPYFGLFDVLVRAFVPDLKSWFDPTSNWDFVGAQMTRYFKGPAIIMVKAPPGARRTSTLPKDDAMLGIAPRKSNSN
ncbi:MAG TPA: hypothetical protein VMA09_09355 [Candidatus Binataceae bacterium]|nr:hypothetical protein [Candidatus Binataceae bacterium]